jgi:hypothetical protein
VRDSTVHLKGIPCKQRNIYRIPDQSENFDEVTCGNCIRHYPFKEMRTKERVRIEEIEARLRGSVMPENRGN